MVQSTKVLESMAQCKRSILDRTSSLNGRAKVAHHHGLQAGHLPQYFMMAVLLHITPEQFLLLGLELAGFGPNRLVRMTPKSKLSRFLGFYGTWPEVLTVIFDDLQTTDIDKAAIEGPSSKDFLITFHWLACYNTETVMSALFKMDEKTLRNKIRKYVNAIHGFIVTKIIMPDLNTVPETLPLTVDGVHCRMFEQHMRPNRKWKSFKLSIPGLAYELGVAVFASKIIWIAGPRRGGTRDIDIFNEPGGLASLIPAGKKAIVDKGYPGVSEKVSQKLRNFDGDEVYHFKNQALARHETVNSRIKRFSILSDRFRHRGSRLGNTEDYHKVVFETVCVIVQYEFDNGHPVFDI